MPSMDALDEAIDYILDKNGNIPRAQIDAALLRAGHSPETIEDLWIGVGEARMVEVFEVGPTGVWMLPWLDEFDLDEIAASEEFMRWREAISIYPRTEPFTIPWAPVDPDGVLYVIGRRIFRSAARGSLLNATQQALGSSYVHSARVDHQQEDVIDLDMPRRSPPDPTPDLDLGDRRNAAQRSLGGVLSMILVPFIWSSHRSRSSALTSIAYRSGFGCGAT